MDLLGFANAGVSGLQRAVVVRRILSEIDTPRFRAIQAEFEHVDPAPGASKYLDARPWLIDKLRHAERIGLTRRGRPLLDVLDLGTGPGYFPLICRHYGHRPAAIDLGQVDMYNALVDCFAIERKVHTVTAEAPLPDFGRRFDLVTAFMVCFNGHKSDALWGPAEWGAFLTNLAEHTLRPRGRLYLVLNAEHDGRFLTDETARYFRDLGARVDGAVVDLPDLRRLPREG